MTQVVDIDQTFSSLGLSNPTADEEDVKEEMMEIVDENSEDDEESLENTDDTQDTSEEDEEPEEEEFEEDYPEDDTSDPELSSEVKKREAAESRMRELQSQVDRQNAENDAIKQQLQQVYAEVVNMKEKDIQEESEVDVGDDDDLVDAGKMKAYVDAQMKAQQQAAKQRELDAQNAWLRQQPDLNDVNKYITEKNLTSDPTFVNAKTDNIGLYYMVKDRMVQERLTADASKKKESKGRKKRRGRVPPTGGPRGNSRKQSGNLSQTERQLKNLGERLGLDLAVVNR